MVLALIGFLGAGCGATSIPNDSVVGTEPSSPTTTTIEAPLEEFQEPAVPDVGGEGLPDTPGGTEEIDCNNAEALCDSGEWACDDIADYCDVGPDGGELPDDWDWDS